MDLLQRLRAVETGARIGGPAKQGDTELIAEWDRQGAAFVSSDATREGRYWQAVRELFACIKSTAGGAPILHEGGVYMGCWLESTGTINSELMARFLPDVAARTFAGFAEAQREDGLMPYKLTDLGPVIAQIQLVSPLARSVWSLYSLGGADRDYLRRMYGAMGRYDDWLATHRDTRGTGGVEAFCTFDTGHDLSSRFWHAPDSPHRNDPAASPPDNPVLPYVAPDLTANVACQRLYLARIAEELGEDPAPWREKADRSLAALFEQCWDEEDGFFYDRDRNGKPVRVQSDVLLRVLACEVGDDALFAGALERYLLNTGKFFAKYPFTSVAMDDPRFDPSSDYNTWGGTSNFLSLIRAPAAFEAHGRYTELTWVLHPILSAMALMDRFPQCLSPYTGAAGFTEMYSPAILCQLDYVERLSGILPRPDGTLWFTGLTPAQMDHRDAVHETGYARSVDGCRFELVNAEGETRAWCDGEPLFRAPQGVRLVTGRDGAVRALVGMTISPVEGALETSGGSIDFRVKPNEWLELRSGRFESARDPGLTTPTY